MRKDDGVDGDAQRIGQLTWMLFLKVFDQREEEWEDDKTDYISPIPEKYRCATGQPTKPMLTARKAADAGE